ncbi:thiol-disulfide oxidoreductase DCC family protein [Devosia nitrariae]|uniref:Thiol-disulfide oxidoreductase n=1 Tax=Devosia nitrariae TaxID=2071872 RepID=A0ABQ5WAP1_9HYPH|nr:thiol-disulfide oxidoreductase DCC family protein [Devosia nitrariae]GLQ57141.1 thiol-disulfide oxidoreductase [Devosia nitrariae]
MRRSPDAREAPYSYRSDPNVPPFPDDQPIIVFDGECKFCSGWVRFALRHDRSGRYRFLPAQSPLGAALYQHYGLDPTDYETNILIRDGRALFKAEGSLQMIAGLGFPWSLINLARVFPRPLLDRAYDLIASNRFRWFGRRESCFVPDAGVRARFLA